MKTDRPQFTIITKAYNVEEYIEECIQSVRMQTLGDFEWLILDNGSTDRTGEILKEQARLDERIRLYVNNKNYNKRGYSEGYYNYSSLFQQSRGIYIVDLDSDDYLATDYLEQMYAVISSTDNPEIIAAGSVQFMDGNENESRIIVPKKFVGTDISQMGEHMMDFYDAFRPVWGKCILRKFYWENYDYIYNRNIEIVSGSDTLVCLGLLQKAKRCVCIERALYYYRIRKNSVLKTQYSENRQLGYDVLYEEGKRLLDIWDKSTPENLYFLCLVHLGGIQLNLDMIAQTQAIPVWKRLDFIENLLENPIFCKYVIVLPEMRKRALEQKLDEALEQIYKAYEIHSKVFYRYNFGRRFLSQRAIKNNRAGYYEIALYVAAFGSRKNRLTYENEMFCLGVGFLQSQDTLSFSKVHQMYLKLKEIPELSAESLWESAMDCRLCGNIGTALQYLSIGDELYTDQKSFREQIDLILLQDEETEDGKK